jgi:DNA-binding SARP family transcriptional activator
LLAYLAREPGRAYTRDQLAGLLAGDESADPRAALRLALFEVRRALPAATPSILVAEGDTLALNRVAAYVDVAAFEAATATGTAGVSRAARLYRGDFLEGFPAVSPAFEAWLTGERERLQALGVEALSVLLQQQVSAGAHTSAVQTAVRLLAIDPLQEPAHRTLITLYRRQGRVAAALKQYQACADALRRELGVEPDEATTRLYRELLAARTSSIVRRPTTRRCRADRRMVPTGEADDQPPLVGRRYELRILSEALAVTETSGRVVVLLGEAGSGKTRLVTEAIQRASALGRGVLYGRAYESERILPFGPWLHALRASATRAPETLQEGLAPGWRAQLGRILPEWRAQGRAEAACADDAQGIFDALATLIESLARPRPLLLALEDLHWADEMSLRALAVVGRRLRSLPVLLVASAREEELPDAPRLQRLLHEFQDEPWVTRLAVAGLSRAETGALARRLGAAAGAGGGVQLFERIWRLSTGNPFTIVTAVRALREGHGSDIAGELPLPARVRELVNGRLARLEPASRELLAVAAVAGRDVEWRLLQRASGLGEREVADRLEALVARRFLSASGDRLDFSHDYVRAAVREGLLAPRHRLLHGAVAAAIEALYAADPEPHVFALGTHYATAEVWDRAAGYLPRAGGQAYRASAYTHAVRCFEQALSALAHLPETRDVLEAATDLRLDLRNALFPAGDFERIGKEVEQAATLAARLGDARRLARTAVCRAHYLTEVGRLDEALEASRHARELAGPPGSSRTVQLAHMMDGLNYLSRGDFRKAADILRVRVDEESQVREGYRYLSSAFIDRQLVAALSELGFFAEALTRAEEALRTAEATERPAGVAQALICVGGVLLVRGDFREAVAPLERAFGICERAELGWLAAAAASMLGICNAWGLIHQGQRRSRVLKFERVEGRTDVGQGLVAARVRQGVESDPQALSVRDDVHAR